jgi:23S rRNA pseudouridine1911/1915/1917 synthase
MHLIEIIYEDTDLVVINKPCGIASQPDTKNTTNKLTTKGWMPAHRLDQRVSGLLLLAKNEQILALLNEAFAQHKIKKLYKAVVTNKPNVESTQLIHWLLKDGIHKKSKAFTKEVAHSKKAQLKYELIQSSQKYHLLSIELFTGRFHQIRAQLAAIGSPIVGDVKYGFKRTTPDGSIFLQSYCLEFVHPISKESLSFELAMPELWKKYGF